MYQINLINGLMLPNPNGTTKTRPNPYAQIIAETDSGKYEIGKTQVCPNTCNPVWDKDASRGFIVTYPILKKIIILVYDSQEGKETKTELGRHILDFENGINVELNILVQLPLETSIESKFKPSIQIKFGMFFDQIPKFSSNGVQSQLSKYNRVYFTLTYDPPILPEQNGLDNIKLSFLTFDLEDGGRARLLPRMCNNDNRGVKVKHPKFPLTKTGWTPIASFHLPKLECHLFSQVEMLYLPLIECKGYRGKITLFCYGASKDITKTPFFLFSDTFEFEHNDLMTSSYVFQPSPNLGEYHIKTIEKHCRSEFQNDLVFANYMKYLSLPLAAKKFLRLELDIDKAVTLSYASKFHRKSLPGQLVFYTDWMSTAGHPLDLGIEVYDSNFESVDRILADKHEACNGALTWNVSTDGRFEKFKKDTLFLRVKLSYLPSNIKYLSVALAAYSLKPFPLKWGGFFRLYDEDDLFEYMNLSIRDKGTATGVVVCIMMKLDNNDWLVIPTIKTFTIKQGPPGLLQHFRLIGDYLRDSKYLSEISESMNQYESPEPWYELQKKIDEEKEKKAAEKEPEGEATKD